MHLHQLPRSVSAWTACLFLSASQSFAMSVIGTAGGGATFIPADKASSAKKGFHLGVGGGIEASPFGPGLLRESLVSSEVFSFCDRISGTEPLLPDDLRTAKVGVEIRGVGLSGAFLFGLRPLGLPSLAAGPVAVLWSKDMSYGRATSSQGSAVFAGLEVASSATGGMSLTETVKWTPFARATVDLTVPRQTVARGTLGVRIGLDINSKATRAVVLSGHDDLPGPRHSSEPQTVVVHSREYLLPDESVNFAFDSAELSSESLFFVRLLGAILAREEFGVSAVTVTGHTDSQGSNAYNDRLAADRAVAVQRALESGGLRPGLVGAQSAGARSPVSGGSNELSMAKNRRVEIAFQAARNHERLRLFIDRAILAAKKPR